jgi:anaerobic selenocysteine-containing dehydrogenase
MKEHGGPPELAERWTPYPQWAPIPMDGSPAEYDLILMDFKRIEYKQTRTENPLLAELAPDNPLIMNSTTARRRGFRDGDLVEIESHNPVTGETARTRTVLATTEGIRPDTVGLTHHRHRLGLPSANELLFYGPGFWDIGSAWFSHAKVKVRKVKP